MNVQPVSSLSETLEKRISAALSFFSFCGSFSLGLILIIGNAAPVCNVGRLAGTVLTILTVLTVFSTPLKPACTAAFRKMQISKCRKSYIKMSQVVYQNVASGKIVTICFYLLFVNDIPHKIQPLPLIWFVSVSGCQM